MPKMHVRMSGGREACQPRSFNVFPGPIIGELADIFPDSHPSASITVMTQKCSVVPSFCCKQSEKKQ